MVFYRKYRPQKIKDLDSKEIQDKLLAVFGSKSPPHAFLFTGPKGLGKTSTARIVAKALNCEKKTKGVEPCNKCDQCISITNGTNMDILEIDGASNRGIDEIRDLREKVKLMPSSARKKVYIIDEVHMLTTEAFNALLKTLEEPPSHVVFILCTTEPHKVPSTILSRCFHIQFKKATSEELVRSFERIIKAEKIRTDKEALSLIASFSDGSFRDGVKILEEMALALGRKKLTKELIEEKYKVSGIEYQVGKILEFLENRDSKKSLELVSKLVEEGVGMEYFLNQMIQTLHGRLLYKLGVKNNEELISNNVELDTQDLKKLIELLSRAHGELRYAVLQQLPLELAIVEWGLLDESRRPHVASEANPTARGPVAPSSHPMSSLAGSLRPLDGTPSSRATPRIDGLDSFWKELINKVKVYNHSVAGVLRGCRIKSYDDSMLIIATNFKFHKEKLDDPKSKSILAKATSEIAGKSIDVSVVLGVKKND